MPRPTTALIVDDEKHVRLRLKELGNSECRKAANGEQARRMGAAG